MEFNQLVRSLQSQVTKLNSELSEHDEVDGKGFQFKNIIDINKFVKTANQILSKLLVAIKQISDQQLVEKIVLNSKSIVEAVLAIVQILIKSNK